MAGKSKHPWFWPIVALTGYMMLYVVFVDEVYLNRLVESEQRLNAQFYSPELATASSDRATRWFNAAFIDTGIMAHSFEPFVPTEAQITRTKGLEDFGRPVFDWFDARIRAWWTLIWSAFTRVSSVLLWAPFALFLIAPWVVDGFVQREIRKHTFDYASPIQQRYAMRALTSLPLLFIVFLIAPIPLHPLATPILALAVGMLLQRAVKHFMKRA